MIDAFAQNLLQNHAQGSAFTVGLPGEEDGDEVAAAFVRLGCLVEPDPFDLSLRITPPKAA